MIFFLNVSSTGAFQPGPYTSTYFASKAFVLSYSRAIRYEAKKKGIQVCALCPGAMQKILRLMPVSFRMRFVVKMKK